MHWFKIGSAWSNKDCIFILFINKKLNWLKFYKKRMRYFIGIIALVILSTSCKTTDNQGIYKYGRIDYKITYLENNLHSISPSLLPKKMKLEFNQEHSINLIEGFMGVFKLNNTISFKHKKSSTLLEILNKNYIFKGKKGDEMCCFDAMKGMKIKYTDETKIIAGLNCKNAIIELPTGEVFEIYYTNEINLQNPNITNPYENIEGVLMDFQLYLAGVKMKFTAEKFQNVDNVDLQLNVPENTAEVTREQMNSIICKLME